MNSRIDIGRKRVRLLTTVFLVIITSFGTAAHASDLGPVIYIGGGVDLSVIPRQFRSGWDNGVSGDIGIGITLSRQVEVAVSFRQSTFETDAAGMLDHFDIIRLPEGAVYEISGGRFRTYELTADLRLAPRLSRREIPFRLYFMGSAGIGRTNISAAKLAATLNGVTMIKDVAEKSETGAALGCGLGADYSLSSHLGLWFEFTYYGLVISDKATAYFPIRGGLRFDFGR